MPNISDLKVFKGNRIKWAIDRFSVQNNREQDTIYEEIKNILGIKNQFTQFLNNHAQPDLNQLVVIAQICQCPVDDLLLTE